MAVVPKPLAFALLISSISALGAEKIDYSRDVLPILSANCFPCHGRDPSTREAKLRLDVREDAIAPRNSGMTAITPGNPDASEIITRITSKHEDERMPPADKGRALYSTEIETLRAWIAQGAEYSEHWAFMPLRRPPVPEVGRVIPHAPLQDARTAQTRPTSPIDAFILARLEKENLRPAPAASPETFIRRASLDLLGLLPTPAEIETFRADSIRNPESAIRNLIDRLLASPHYGERWGRHWLDVARYADSGGFETDIFFGHAWRYRDYVIRSFNADKPFDRFIKEQIAGDELFPDDPEARLATGLYTTGPVLQEAGMVSGKLEYDQNTDFVDTTGAAFLGLTFACARCHDHKYDPIAQKEYFSLQAIFAASDQVDFNAAGSKLRDRAALKNTLKEFEAEQARNRAVRETDLARRAELLRKTGDAYIESDPQLKSRIDESRRYNIVARAVERYHRAATPGGSVDPAETSALIDEEEGDDNNLIALKAALRGVLHAKPADAREAALLHVGIVALLNPAPRGSGGAGNRAQVAQASPPAPQAATEQAGTPALPQTSKRGGFMSPRRAFAALQNDDEKRAFLLDLGQQQLELQKPAGYVEDIDALRLQIGEKHLNDTSPIPNRFLAHREKPIETRVLKRGELEMPGDVAEPGIPEKLAVGTMPSFAALPPNRLRAALAEWIASPQNLLTARVVANRVWQWHFGEGLVRTPNDFGIRGERPSHPELLDWLATELIAHGWSLKHLHRVIMTSNAYRMAATADATALRRDPDNVLLTRFQPHRLQAEIIWDNIRRAAGTLDLRLFGLPVAPPLDEQEQLGNYRKWPTSTPDEANRRALYILVRRSFRFPMLSAFDLPDNISSCGRRDITTVPNQALTLLNNRTMQEQARAFAERLLKETNGQCEAVPARAWLHAYARPIRNDERAQANAFLRERGGDRAAVTELCLALFNTNEFIYQQ